MSSQSKKLPLFFNLHTAVKIAKEMVETLHDDVKIPDCVLNNMYIDVKILEDGTYKESYGTGIRPKAIKTVGDLRAITLNILLSYPRIGPSRILDMLTKIGNANGLDMDFAHDKGRRVPAEMNARVMHAIHNGFTVAYTEDPVDDLRNPGGVKLIRCVKAFEIVRSKLVETINTDAYNNAGSKAGIGGGHTHDREYEVAKNMVCGHNVLQLTAQGAIDAQRRYGDPRPRDAADLTLIDPRAVKICRLDDGRTVRTDNGDIADRLAVAADLQKKIEKQNYRPGQLIQMSELLMSAEREIRKLRLKAA